MTLYHDVHRALDARLAQLCEGQDINEDSVDDAILTIESDPIVQGLLALVVDSEEMRALREGLWNQKTK